MISGTSMATIGVTLPQKGRDFATPHGRPLWPHPRRESAAVRESARVILDLFSRFVVGWAISARITQDPALEALAMALAHRRPPHGLVHYSDRGSQYASAAHQSRLAQHGIQGSMSRRGNCWDNAVAESFFATLKVELVHDVTWATRAGARPDLFDYLRSSTMRSVVIVPALPEPPGLRAPVGAGAGSVTQVSIEPGQVQAMGAGPCDASAYVRAQRC
jgi:transposase InsO family protein